MPLQVLHLIGGGEIGGAEQHVLNLATHFDRREVNPFLGCLVKDAPFAAVAASRGIPTEVFAMKLALDISPVKKVLSFCRNKKIGLIHCHGARANLIGRIAAKLLAIPSVSTVHSFLKYDYPFSWKGKLALALENKTAPFCSGLITVSDGLRETVRESLSGKNKIPVKTIYNGIPRHDFSERERLRREFRLKWNIADQQKVIGTIGRLHPVKGQVYLAEAVNLLAKEYPGLHLLIIGEGPQHAELKELLEGNRLSYTLTGYLPSAWRALPAMDIFVLPSISEGMGLVLLEAAQAGVPIIASKVGGIPELFSGKQAILVNPREPLEISIAISKLLSDQSLAQRLAESALERALSFTAEKMAQETTKFYFEIIS